jgi:hypothetical protein
MPNFKGLSEMQRIVRIQFEEKDDHDVVSFFAFGDADEENRISWFESASPGLIINGRRIIIDIIIPILEKVTESEFFQRGTFETTTDWIRKDYLEHLQAQEQAESQDNNKASVHTELPHVISITYHSPTEQHPSGQLSMYRLDEDNEPHKEVRWEKVIQPTFQNLIGVYFNILPKMKELTGHSFKQGPSLARWSIWYREDYYKQLTAKEQT